MYEGPDAQETEKIFVLGNSFCNILINSLIFFELPNVKLNV